MFISVNVMLCVKLCVFVCVLHPSHYLSAWATSHYVLDTSFMAPFPIRQNCDSAVISSGAPSDRTRAAASSGLLDQQLTVNSVSLPHIQYNMYTQLLFNTHNSSFTLVFIYQDKGKN